MTKNETIQVLQSIEDRAVDFPYMTACDWVAIAAAKRHLTEEPVSEDLEEAATLYAKEEYSRKNPATLPDRCIGCYAPIMYAFRNGANWREKQIMANTADAVIGLPYENKDGGYTHLIDVSRPLPVGNNKIAIIFKED